MNTISSRLFSLIRFFFGFIFLWAFLDKTFGLGLSTSSSQAWIAGGSPTTNFLAHAVSGPFASFFQGLSGIGIVDWLFMLGLLGVGLSFLTHRYIRFAGIIGALMLLLMYCALLWPTTNPFLDSHIMYALMMLYIAYQSRR